MSRVEIVTKEGETLGVIDELAGTVQITEAWKARTKKRKKKSKEEELEEKELEDGRE